jgi:methionyl-tRNA formyltransferase
LKKRIEALAERIHFVPDIHASQVLARVRALEPDLGLVYGSPILKPALFEIPRFGSLGIHHGKLPEYRGKKTTFWAMARGEPTAGVTIQKIGAGLDTGEIVAQGEVPIDGRSYRRVWEEVEELGVELYMTAVLETKRGDASGRPSGGESGTLYRDPKLGDLLRFQWRRLGRR